MDTYCVANATTGIAGLAERYTGLLTPDDGCQYDQLIEINLDEVRIVWDSHSSVLSMKSGFKVGGWMGVFLRWKC